MIKIEDMSIGNDLKIESFDNPEPNDFKLLSKNLTKPLVIKRALDESKMISLWSVDYFRKTLGNHLIKVRKNDIQGRWHEKKESENIRCLHMRLEAFIDLLLSKQENHPKYYASQINLSKLTKLKQDIDTPKFLTSTESINLFTRLWLGKNSATQLHYDLTHNFLAQIWGKKSIILYPPSVIRNFYPMKYPGLLTTSQIKNPNYLNKIEFPLFKKNKSINLTLEEREILFIPPFWWHFIQGDNHINLSISYHYFKLSFPQIISPYFYRCLKYDPVNKIYNLFLSKYDRSSLLKRILTPFMVK